MSNRQTLFNYLARPDISGGDSVFLVLRHGESWGQLLKATYKLMGDNRMPITEKGQKQSSAVGKIIGWLGREWNIAAMDVFSGSGSRCVYTTEGLAGELRPLVPQGARTIERALDKQAFGKFDGHFSPEERRKYAGEAVFNQYEDELDRVGPFHVRPPGGESIADVCDRIRTFVDSLRNRPGFYVIVTHGTNALCIESVLTGRGENWILGNVDTYGNCEARMIAGSAGKGFKAQIVCYDPQEWLVEKLAGRRAAPAPFAP